MYRSSEIRNFARPPERRRTVNLEAALTVPIILGNWWNGRRKSYVMRDPMWDATYTMNLKTLWAEITRKKIAFACTPPNLHLVALPRHEIPIHNHTIKF